MYRDGSWDGRCWGLMRPSGWVEKKNKWNSNHVRNTKQRPCSFVWDGQTVGKGGRKGSAKLEKVFSFSPRRSERGKKNLSRKGVVEGRLKGAILFAVSKWQNSLSGKDRPHKKSIILVCRSLSLLFKQKYGLVVSENRVPRKRFAFKSETVTEGWRNCIMRSFIVFSYTQTYILLLTSVCYTVKVESM